MSKKKIFIIALIIAFVVAYGILPIDITPDFIAGLGHTDDIGMIVAGILGVVGTALAGRRQKATVNNEGSYREL